MASNRFAVPLSELEDGARVGAGEQVQEQAEPRLHAPWVAGAVLPLAGGSGGVDDDGE